MIYIVYKIEVDGVIRYIGHTNNIKRRQTQHNYLFKKDKKKDLYYKIKLSHSEYKFNLVEIKRFKSKTEAKRWEALLILLDHFRRKNLWQKPPQIKDM